MKVGILLLNNSDGIEGGGFTFKNEVMRSLKEFSSKSNHSFVLFGFDNIFSSSDFKFVSLNRSLRERFTSKADWVKNIIFKLLHPTQVKIEDTFIKYLYQKLYENEVDIIWYLTPFSCPIIEIPYITVVWDLQHRLQPYFPEVSTQGEWDWREQIFDNTLKRATVVLTGSEAGKAEIERFYQVAKDNIKILPLPTPHFALDGLPNEEQLLEKYNIQGNYLFYPAQFWAHKNHVGLLLAVQLLRDKYDLVFSIVFVGSDKGNQQYIREVAASLNLTAQVHFLGFVPQQDLIELYRNAFALTFLSFFGPDNLPPLEAFALGCPVIASDVPGVEEQLGDAAILVNPRDPQEIAKAIASLYHSQDLYQTLIKRGLERAYRWTGQDYVKGVFSILDELEPIRRCWSSKEPLHQR